MPRYDYKCPQGHVTEALRPIGEAPPSVLCTHPDCWHGVEADRVFSPPAAIHFKGPGFYATDVKGRIGRKRRPNPGDDLHKPFDHAAAKIADGI